VLVRHLWEGSTEPFEGEFYSIPALRLEKPLQAGGPRMLVGAFSEPGYRRAAHLGDGFIHGGGPPGRVKQTFDHIRDMRQRLDKKGSFEFWVQVKSPRDSEEWQQILHDYEAAGADGVIVGSSPHLREIIG
jgi:alkanesulfonate monooxygenase SsuD/methylene tetrahydromethanopterin reductase-like flavin-dependent oxidoreductase (luciferase family)